MGREVGNQRKIMLTFTLDPTRKTKRMDMADTCGPMEAFTKVSL